MTTTGDDHDTTFPNFQLDETIQQFWQGETIEDFDTVLPAIPYKLETSEAILDHNFSLNDEDYVYCSTEYFQSDKQDEDDQFEQVCDITLNDEKYYLKTVIKTKGKSAKISIKSRDCDEGETCTLEWSKLEKDQDLQDEWKNYSTIFPAGVYLGGGAATNFDD